MKNIRLNVDCGNTFQSVSKKAKEIATERRINVEFKFNGILCIVDSSTNLDYLYRDYCNAWTMNWNLVGPKTTPIYDIETTKELERLTQIKEEKYAKQQEKYRKKEEAAKVKFETKVSSIELELKDVEGWMHSREINTDPYGKCTLDFAEGWAKLMQMEIKEKGYSKVDYAILNGIAEKTSRELDFLGITGFMYGYAVNLLSQCWIHGEELRKWHNKEYGHEGDGVVNPALLTITIKD